MKFKKRNRSILHSGGLKKLKNESVGTVLATVRTDPRDLCFCFFLIVFTVTFLSLHHVIEQPCKKIVQ